MADDALVIFTPSGRRGRFPEGTTVLDAARSLGVDIDSVCGGRGICGRCQVTQGLGAFPKHGIVSEPDHLSAFAALETTYREEKGLAADRRLSCTAQVCGDVLIDVPPESQVHRQVVRKGLDVRTFIVDPVVRLHYVEVTPPELASPTGDLARLFEALGREWQLTDLEADLQVVRDLQPALEKGKYGVTVAVHQGRQVIGIWPGLHEKAYGVAIDIGSTTIAGHLADLADGAVLASNGVMNPQIRFGEDLMSRVSYAMMHPEGAGEMTAAVRKALDGLIASLAMRAGIKRVEILELALVGNPIMHHLLLGIDPTPLGGAPFALATDRAVSTTAAELGLRAHPGARVYVLPCIAGHVGADTAGVILAEQPHQAERMTLVVDVGTNAEIVLGDKRRLLAASSPTGPAFEGAQILGGQRAAPGAIERVRIDRETSSRASGSSASTPGRTSRRSRSPSPRPGSPASAGRGSSRSSPRCSWLGSSPRTASSTATWWRARRASSRTGGRSATSSTRATGPGWSAHRDHPERRAGHPARQGGPLRRRPPADGQARDRRARRDPPRGRLREPDRPGPRDDPRADPRLRSRPRPLGGDAAGTGALIALLSGAARTEIEGVVRRVEKIETAVEPRFQEHFVEAMAFPHKTAAFPHLGAVVPLPPRTATTGAAGAGARAERRRRRTVAIGTREDT